jgi:hypothetical protein
MRCYTPQEPHKHQVEFLASNLSDYGWVGEGRNPVIFGLGEEVSWHLEEGGRGKGLHWLLRCFVYE